MTDGGAAEAAVQELELAARVRREAEGLRERIAAAAAHAQATADRVAETRERLVDETRDVRRLESLSWTRILAGLKGDRITAVERETAERDAARYAVADAEAREAVARRDVEGLRARLDELGDVDARFSAALEAKHAWAATHAPEVARALAAVAERRGMLAAEDAEAREAHAAGVVAREHLVQAQRLLGSAESWSTWDTFGGGGLITDMVKYDRLDQVAEVLRRADLALRSFTRELADVHRAGVEGVQVDGLTRTFDVFFDNIFSDLAVRSRIQDAGRRVQRAVSDVDRTLVGLSERGRGIADELAALARQREELLLR